MKSKSIVHHGSRGATGSKPHRVGPRPMFVVTAASTRARESVASARHGKVNIGKETPAKITGKTGLRPVVKHHG